MTKQKIIFFGNGPLADAAFQILNKDHDIIFHARSKSDLETVKKLKSQHPNAFGILASFGVILKPEILELFEPYGILNIHPSLLPKYRGPSPIETAIKNGDTTFGVSVMKIVEQMDAGPVYVSLCFDIPEDSLGDRISSDSLISKIGVYHRSARLAATWISDSFLKKPDEYTPLPQKGTPSYTKKLDKSLSPLDPTTKTARELLNEIRAYLDFPTSRYTFAGKSCIIKAAHIAPASADPSPLSIKCRDGQYLVIDVLQPEGKRPMDAKSFINGYLR